MALLTDSSTNNFQLTAFGDTAVNTTTFKYGGGSAYFDGDEDYIRGNQLFDYSSNFTIEGWVYRTSSGSLFTIFEAGDIQGDQGGVHFYIDGGGTFVLNDGISGDIQGGTATLNQWVHFAIVRNNNVNTLYINGTAVGSGSQTYPVTNDIFTIGAAPNYGFYFQGYLDDFRVTSGIARYTSNFTPPAQQLRDPSDPYIDNVSLLLHMDGADGSTTFTDSSTNNFTLTAFGNAQIDTAIKKFGSGAALFDGNGDYLRVYTNEEFSSGNWTTEMWIYPNNVSGEPRILSRQDAGDAFVYQLRINNENLGLLIRRGNGSDFAIIGESAACQIFANVWQHIAITRNGNTISMYINGNSVASVTFSGIYDSTLNPPWIIGAFADSNLSPQLYFSGSIDELRITKGVARYTANFVPQTAPFAL